MEYLENIIHSASSIYDRLEDAEIVPNNTKFPPLAHPRIVKWIKNSCKEDLEYFKERILVEGWNLNDINAAINPTTEKIGHLPKWARLLQKALNYTPSPSSFEQRRKKLLFIETSTPIPFEDILSQLVEWASRELKRNNSSAISNLNQESIGALERHLLKKLSNICKKTFFQEFSLILSLERIYNPLSYESHSKQALIYKQFSEDMTNGKLVRVFEEYAVLARLVGTSLNNWLSSTSLLINRLKSDWSEIEYVLNQNTRLAKVSAILPGLSDPHHKGQTVMSLAFSCGLEIIYKPRAVEMEAAFSNFLKWVNQVDSNDCLYILTVIEKDGYGWVEKLQHLPCVNDKAIESYYIKAGKLLMLMYLLNGQDCHYENLIACGADPVFIDLEALFHHQGKEVFRETKEKSISTATFIANMFLEDSVINTGLLPCWEAENNGEAYDVSGLSSIPNKQEPIFSREKWYNINTDKMCFRIEKKASPPRTNLPFTSIKNSNSADYLNQVIEGFTRMYETILDHRLLLLSNNSPLEIFLSKNCRYIFRSTRFYYFLQMESLEPKYLRNGFDRSIMLDRLNLAFTLSENRPFHKLLKEEHLTLEQLDIPYFTVSNHSDNFPIGESKQLKNVFRDSSYNDVLKKISYLSTSDLHQQSSYIHSSILCGVRSKLHNNVKVNTQKNQKQSYSIQATEYIDWAERIGQEIAKMAIRGEDQSITWISPSYLESINQYQLRPLACDLYNGLSGLLLFYGALANATSLERYHDITKGIHKTLHQYALFLRDEHNPNENFGGVDGISSAIYSLTKAYTFLGDKSFLHSAQLLIDSLTHENICADKQYDIISGSAGAILCLLAHYKVTHKAESLEKAQLYAQHLLNNRIEFKSFSTWQAFHGHPPLSGFSHGAAGITYALSALNNIAPNKRYTLAINDGLAYERHLYDEENANWLDLQRTNGDGDKYFGSTWCHGAPGIGLARSGMYQFAMDTDIKHEIEQAMQQIQSYDLFENDHLCCGNMGLADCIFTSGIKTNTVTWEKHGQQIASTVLVQAKQHHIFSLSDSERGYPIGFFQGTSGIGYQLLRFTNPKLFSSVLLLE